jgi:hypothetical protein
VERALLIASQTAGLRGCHGDAELMADALDQWGFQCTRVTDGTATQERILTAYRALIEETAAGDAVVVYYSGHGGRMRNLTSINETTAAYWQFIVPTDFEESTPEDFRGILAEELRTLQLELSTKTDNVTTILDCCHSALMSRDPAMVARFLQRPWTELRSGAVARWENADDALRSMLASSGLSHEDAESNQRAVRVVACLPTESAFEMQSQEIDGVHGLLTESVVGILRDVRQANGAGDVTWEDVGALARAWVLARAPSQHVVVEGPARRRLFSSEERDTTRGWPVEVADGAVSVPGAAFLGVGPGDTLALVPGGTDAADASVEAVVRRIEGGRAFLELVDGSSSTPLGPGTVAHPATVSSRPREVVVAAPTGAERDQIVAAIAGSSRVEAVEEAKAPLATVVADASGLMLVNTDGMPQYAEPRPVTPEVLGRLTGDLEHLAKLAVLRELTSGSGDEALEIPVGLTVHADPSGPPLESGVTLSPGPVFLRVHHLGRPNDPPVFANVIDLDQAGNVSVMSAEASPTGIQLTPKQTHQLYGDEGAWLSWPEEGFPRDEPRPETFMAVFSDGEHDLRAVATSGIAARGSGGGGSAGSLQRTVDLAASSVSRSAGPRPDRGPAPLRYRVERFEFLLDPGFLVDKTLQRGDRAEVEASPIELGVRLVELVARGRGRGTLATDVRVDALFVTAAAAGGNRVTARTWRFPALDGDGRLPQLPLDLFAGPVQSYLELAIWVSRANQPNPDLTDLFGEPAEPGAPAQDAPQLVARAGSCVRRAVNRSFALHRGTVLVPEGLADRRRPATGLHETTDLAFAYELVVPE